MSDAARVEKALAIVDPVVNRTKEQIGTHFEGCYKYHLACLAVAVQEALDGSLPHR